MNAPALDLAALRDAILAADLDTRIQVDALLGAPWTDAIDAAWVESKLLDLTHARLWAVAVALQGPSASSLDEELDADGFPFLADAPDVELDGADFEDVEMWDALGDDGYAGPDDGPDDGLPVFTLDDGGCTCLIPGLLPSPTPPACALTPSAPAADTSPHCAETAMPTTAPLGVPCLLSTVTPLERTVERLQTTAEAARQRGDLTLAAQAHSRVQLYRAAERELFRAAQESDEGRCGNTPSAVAEHALELLRADGWPEPVGLHDVLRAEARWMLGGGLAASATPIVADALTSLPIPLEGGPSSLAPSSVEAA